MRLWWILVALIILLATSQVSAALLRVKLIWELSDEQVWRLEVINASVDMLDVKRVTATFYADNRRLWSLPTTLTPSLLRPGEAGWITLDARLVPKQFPLRIDWEVTWNPHTVPVLPRFWQTERVASIEIQLESPSAPVVRRPTPQSPKAIPPVPLWRL